MVEQAELPQKHVVKCENFQRIIEMMYEKGICKSLDLAKVSCQGFSDGCITPPHFSPRDGFPIDQVAFSLEESSAWQLMSEKQIVNSGVDSALARVKEMNLRSSGEPRSVL